MIENDKYNPTLFQNSVSILLKSLQTDLNSLFLGKSFKKEKKWKETFTEKLIKRITYRYFWTSWRTQTFVQADRIGNQSLSSSFTWWYLAKFIPSFLPINIEIVAIDLSSGDILVFLW